MFQVVPDTICSESLLMVFVSLEYLIVSKIVSSGCGLWASPMLFLKNLIMIMNSWGNITSTFVRRIQSCQVCILYIPSSVRLMKDKLSIQHNIYVMYKLRFCISCNVYKKSVQVATCTNFGPVQVATYTSSIFFS